MTKKKTLRKDTTQPKRKVRPPHVPTDASRADVLYMAKQGMVQSEIADDIGIHVKTLQKHYRTELDEGVNLWNAPHKPTSETRIMVMYMAANAETHNFIADKLSVCVDTLRRYYRAELDAGKADLSRAVGCLTYQLAMRAAEEPAYLGMMGLVAKAHGFTDDAMAAKEDAQGGGLRVLKKVVMPDNNRLTDKGREAMGEQILITQAEVDADNGVEPPEPPAKKPKAK